MLALRLPRELVALVQDYLDVKDLNSWRATSRQAFWDVETLVRKQVFCLEQSSCVSILQEPTGFFLGSAWFQFVTKVYKCVKCRRYEWLRPCGHGDLDVDCTEAEEEGLCQECFIDSCVLNKCNYCSVYSSVTSQCYHCHSNICGDCDELVNFCSSCNELFCDECRLDNYCMVCL
jgi:hypothetical protein